MDEQEHADQTRQAPQFPDRQARAWNVSSTCYVLGRLALAGVFLSSGTLKLFTLTDFARIIGDYGLLPSALLLPAAAFLVLAELLAGVGLLFDVRYSLALVNAMLVVFIAVLSYGRHLGLDVECGCFGPADPERFYHAELLKAIVRDVLMLALSFWLSFYRARHKIALRSPWPPFSRNVLQDSISS